MQGPPGAQQPVWVEYAADQTITLDTAQYGFLAGSQVLLQGAPKPISVPSGNYQVVTGDRARALIQTFLALSGQTMKLDDGGVTKIYALVPSATYLNGQYDYTNGGIITPPKLDPSTTHVLIRTPPALVFPAPLVVQEYFPPLRLLPGGPSGDGFRREGLPGRAGGAGAAGQRAAGRRAADTDHLQQHHRQRHVYDRQYGPAFRVLR
jgi:hypothetical protein